MNAWRRLADLWSGARLFGLIEPARRGRAPDSFDDCDGDARATADFGDDDDGFAADTDLLVFFVDSAPARRGARTDKRP